jgi:hypothetical protein
MSSKAVQDTETYWTPAGRHPWGGVYWFHNGSGKEDVKGDERIAWWNVGSWEGCWRAR